MSSIILGMEFAKKTQNNVFQNNAKNRITHFNIFVTVKLCRDNK